MDFCFECSEFPCGNLERLDERHRRGDGVSLIGNLLRIREIGARGWLIEQEELWKCPACGGEISVMDGECYDCRMKTGPRKG